MPRFPSDEQLAFHAAVYDTVAQIPRAHVCSYGQIARIIDRPRNARQVGLSLKNMAHYVDCLVDAEGSHLYSLQDIPWWRVINSQGRVSLREPGQVEEQVRRLRQEGVDVQNRPLEGSSPYYVDLDEYGWTDGHL